MSSYTLTHLTDAALLRDLAALFARNRATTAALLAYIAEIDARRLYVPAGYPSMHAFCVAEFGLSEDGAFKRITAARAARQFPAIFDLVSRGRMHLTAVRMLAAHLTPQNAEDLLQAACGLSRNDLEQLLARRQAEDAPPMLPICSPPGSLQLPPSQVVESTSCGDLQLAPGRVDAVSPSPPSALQSPPPSPTVWPDERVVLEVAILRRTHDTLRDLQTLLSHSIPSGDVALVLDRAIQVAIRAAEKRKFAETSQPHSLGRKRTAARTIPAEVRRAVWRRDRGTCGFVSESGRRCASRRFLEFDHVEPVARGGRATVANTRLRCRTHNQYEAERVFGRRFMNEKRDNAGQTVGDSLDRSATTNAMTRNTSGT